MDRPAAKLCRALLVILPLTYILSLLWDPKSLTRGLAMIPANTFLVATKPWNIVTHVLLEVEAATCVLSCVLIATWGAELETELGTGELVKFLLVPTVTVSVSLIVGGALAARLVDSYALFFAHCGFLPCAAMLALLKFQRAPQDPVAAAPVPDVLRVRHVPFLLLLFAIVNDLFTADASTVSKVEIELGAILNAGSALTTAIGFWASWFYLRFVRHPGGDPSLGFALHQLVFPLPLRLLLLTVGTVLFPLVRLCGLGKAVADAPVGRGAAGDGTLDDNEVDPASEAASRVSVSSFSHTAVTIKPLPGSTSAEADRRRAAALSALASRLQLAEAAAAKQEAAGAADDGFASLLQSEGAAAALGKN